jgi:hypothetical protein
MQDDYVNALTGQTPTGPESGSNMVQGPGTGQPSPAAGRPSDTQLPGTAGRPVSAPTITPPTKDAMGLPQTQTQPRPSKVTIDMGQPQKPAIVEPAKEPGFQVPGVPDTSPYGDVYTGADGNKRVRLNEEGRKRYAEEHQRTLARLGPWVDFPVPGAPTPVVRPGRLNFNPITGKFSR